MNPCWFNVWTHSLYTDGIFYNKQVEVLYSRGQTKKFLSGTSPCVKDLCIIRVIDELTTTLSIPCSSSSPQVRQIIRSNPTLHDALVNVVTRSISSGNIVVDLALIFQKSSVHNSSTITMASVVAATAMQDNVLRRSGTAYTVMASATVVQGENIHISSNK